MALANTFEPAERWEFAMAVREQDGALRDALDGAIRHVVTRGNVRAIFAGYGIPDADPSWVERQ